MTIHDRRSALKLAGAGAGLALLGGQPAAAAMPSATANARLVRRYFEEVWNRGALYVLDALLSPNYVNHTPSTPNPPPGPAGLKPIVAGMRTAFPDLHYEIQDIVATPTRAVARVVMTGTHRGDLFGLAATGRRVRVNQINIEEIGPEGRIRNHWRITEDLTLMKQLGAVE